MDPLSVATFVVFGLVIGTLFGFIRMPALIYLIGVPVPIAVGTDLFEIVFSGGIGTFLYAGAGGVDLGIVMPLLAGCALGAPLGAAAAKLVDSDSIKRVVGWMLVGGATAGPCGRSARP